MFVFLCAWILDLYQSSHLIAFLNTCKFFLTIFFSQQGTVTIQYNKLHADPKQGKTLDIAMKKVKHRLVENMSSSTADALGLSRAILCNDSLVKKLDDLQRTEDMYRSLMDHTKRLLKAFFDLCIVYKSELK